MTRRVDRRRFLQASAAAGAATWLAGGTLLGQQTRSPNERLNIGIIGAGGRGEGNIAGVRGENIVALCDVDENRAGKQFEAFPKATKYHDFRRMLEKEKLDAVVISTPDHTHAVAAVMAMSLGKHVYCEKPLTWSVEEARVLRKVAQKMKVATQMGNQGTAAQGLRTAVEVVRAGIIGPVREVHVWTNRPIWDQGMQEAPPPEPVPAHLKWDLWLGPAAERPYSPKYLPFAWRGWWDFGTGALGDMACHTANMAFMALKLGAPKRVSAESGGGSELSPPKWSTITYTFPERGEGFPEVKLIWYDGTRDGKRNLPPAELLPGVKMPTSGSLLIGEKGSLFSPDDYGAVFHPLPKEKFEGVKMPEPTLPRSPGHHQEWILACKGGPPAMSNFDYAGPLTEFVLLGNVAVRAGKPIEWDAESLKVTNVPEADKFIRREYRKGFELGASV
ncbi:MAG TPA: Gfo/Idh/MocA family oxidoreductase [Gemmataceae bacterium]